MIVDFFSRLSFWIMCRCQVMLGEPQDLPLDGRMGRSSKAVAGPVASEEGVGLL